MTTPPIQTLTDELLGEIEKQGFTFGSTLEHLAREIRTLRAQVKALQSDANSWQSGYDEGRRMAGKHRLSEIEQLRAEKAELRKDAGRFAWWFEKAKQATPDAVDVTLDKWRKTMDKAMEQAK
jgi:hypothetical protein